jgi:hypothetical protein
LDYPNPSDLSLGAISHKAILTVCKEGKETEHNNETNLNDVDPVEPVHLHVGVVLLIVSGTISTTVLSEDNNKDHKDRNSEKERNDVRNLIRVHFFN